MVLTVKSVVRIRPEPPEDMKGSMWLNRHFKYDNWQESRYCDSLQADFEAFHPKGANACTNLREIWQVGPMKHQLGIAIPEPFFSIPGFGLRNF